MLEDKNYSEMSEHLGIAQSQIHKNIKKAYDKIQCQSRLTPDQEEITCLLLTKLLI